MQKVRIQRKLSLKKSGKKILIFVFLLVFSSSLYAAHSFLTGTSFTSGADIMVEGPSKGAVTPVSILLPEGKYKVMVRIPGSAWDPDTQTVTVTADNNELCITLLPINESEPGRANRQ
jgi:hypothetical protein